MRVQGTLVSRAAMLRAVGQASAVCLAAGAQVVFVVALLAPSMRPLLLSGWFLAALAAVMAGCVWALARFICTPVLPGSMTDRLMRLAASGGGDLDPPGRFRAALTSGAQHEAAPLLDLQPWQCPRPAEAHEAGWTTPAFNIDGTPMVGVVDINGCAYGLPSGNRCSNACSTSSYDSPGASSVHANGGWL